MIIQSSNNGEKTKKELNIRLLDTAVSHMTRVIISGGFGITKKKEKTLRRWLHGIDRRFPTGCHQDIQKSWIDVPRMKMNTRPEFVSKRTRKNPYKIILLKIRRYNVNKRKNYRWAHDPKTKTLRKPIQHVGISGMSIFVMHHVHARWQGAEA